MAKILEMPKLSPTMEEGVLATWHKKEGDAVDVDDVLAEVETDKATMEFRAFDKGALLKLLVAPGATVRLGQPVAILGQPGEDITSLLKDTAPPAGGGKQTGSPGGSGKDTGSPGGGGGERPALTATDKEAAGEKEDLEIAAETKAEGTPPPATPKEVAPARSSSEKTNVLDRTSHEAAPRPAPEGRVLASPYVRKVARDRGIDLRGKTGSGPGGRLNPSDLEADQVAPAAAPPAPPRDAALAPASQLQAPEVRPLSPMRKAIARRLTEAKQTIPHFYLTADLDARALVALREQVNRELGASETKGHDGPGDGAASKVSLNDFVLKASALALLRVPECNAQFSASDGAILVHRRVDISMAVAVPDGLMTPVVRNADQKSVLAIAREVRDLAGRARAKKLRPEEMQDGTFSISNLGMFGIDHFAAVINPPEGAILAVGRVREEPAVDGGALVVGKRMTVTLSCDHRVVDGAIGAAFLAELRALIEHPMRVLAG